MAWQEISETCRAGKGALSAPTPVTTMPESSRNAHARLGQRCRQGRFRPFLCRRLRRPRIAEATIFPPVDENRLDRGRTDIHPGDTVLGARSLEEGHPFQFSVSDRGRPRGQRNPFPRGPPPGPRSEGVPAGPTPGNRTLSSMALISPIFLAPPPVTTTLFLIPRFRTMLTTRPAMDSHADRRQFPVWPPPRPAGR